MTEHDPFARDPGARTLAERLARLDLATESRVRLSLRARLLARPKPALPFLLRWPAGLAGALAAAAVLLLFLQPRAPQMTPSTVPVPPSSPAEPAARQPAPSARPEQAPLPATPFRSLGPVSPFVARQPASGTSPFQTRSAQGLLETAAGRRITTAHGRAVVWEFAHAAFLLEDRPVRIEELFVKPTP
jgi:hypothetical protein